MRSCLTKAVIFLLAIAATGCSAQNATSIPRHDTGASSSGPALQAPQLRLPLDGAGGPTGRVATFMGDAAPVLYGKTLAHFYIGVREVDAIANGQTTVLGSSTAPVQMDLLQFQNGSVNWMTQTEVPAQTYSQLRYVIDMGSTKAIFTDGSTVPVKFSGQRTASSSAMGASTTTILDATYSNAIDVTVNAPFTVTSITAMMADFNLGESLVASGSAIIMRPTLSAANVPAKITGTIVNAYGMPVQDATVVAVGSSGLAVNSDVTDSNGNFNIHALPAGTYQLLVYNEYENAAGGLIFASGETFSGQGFYGPAVTASTGSTVSAGTIGD